LFCPAGFTWSMKNTACPQKHVIGLTQLRLII
jgi:hypothetical protein